MTELKLSLVRVLGEVHEQLERSIAAAVGEQQLQGLLLPGRQLAQPPDGSATPGAGAWPAPVPQAALPGEPPGSGAEPAPSVGSLPLELFPSVVGTQLGQVGPHLGWGLALLPCWGPGDTPG